MNGFLFAASGIDPNEGAANAFVWYHDKLSNKYSLLGSGHILGAPATQPGVEIGRYSVRFLLPYGYSPENIVVTDDTKAKGVLPGVVVSPMSASSPLPSGATVPRKGALGSTGGDVGPGRAAASAFSRLGNAQESET